MKTCSTFLGGRKNANLNHNKILLECLKLKRLMTLNVHENVGHWNFHILGGNAKIV